MHNSIPRWIFLMIVAVTIGIVTILIISASKPTPSYPAADNQGDVNICFQE